VSFGLIGDGGIPVWRDGCREGERRERETYSSRYRDRETKRQRDKEPKRRRGGGAERQRDKDGWQAGRERESKKALRMLDVSLVLSLYKRGQRGSRLGDPPEPSPLFLPETNLPVYCVDGIGVVNPTQGLHLR
jgi:hypothetical protein